MARAAVLDLRRRHEQARQHVEHLRAIVRDQASAAHRGNEMAAIRLDSLRDELRNAEIDAGRLQALIAEAEARPVARTGAMTQWRVQY